LAAPLSFSELPFKIDLKKKKNSMVIDTTWSGGVANVTLSPGLGGADHPGEQEWG
jgi:hypothetical protein